MKRILFASALLTLAITAGSCDKVEHPYPKVNSSINWSLYPNGDSAHYAQNAWPVFTANPNTLRNALIEDFTGHQCVNCPAQTAFMESLIATNPARILGVGIHAGATGLTGFQVVDDHFPDVFYNDQGLEIGNYFGSIPGSTFIGNPRFAVSRTINNSQYTSTAGGITQPTNNVLASALKVNLQAATNYYPSTRGLFLHVEVDKLDASVTSELGVVVYIIEDSAIARQIIPTADDTDGTDANHDGVPEDPNPDGINETYVHRNIMRGTIDGRAFGRTLTPADLDPNGKYYVMYSYQLPAQYNVDNMHLVIYVYNKTTLEIYHAIEHEMN
jgi:hypothetical protein